ncbi:MAG: Hsp70 family protein, partial [Pirellula sp.]
NMDLALAHAAAQQFADKGTKLNAWQSVSLWHSCRLAKESLLRGEKSPPSYPLSILGRGTKLIGGTVSIELSRALVETTLIDGFFPMVAKDERPMRDGQSGFQEMGLPFEQDTAITRHIASFLSEQLPNASLNTCLTHLLFNGGVFNSNAFRSRLLETIGSWNSESKQPIVLGGVEDLDQAVACGACYYAWAKDHGGIRIRGGTARSYYIGIESSGPAIPGMSRPLQALCVVPQGMEEGTQTDVASREVGLKVGQRARFRFFSSSTRKLDKPGTYLRSWDEDELSETSPLEVELSASDGEQVIPVRFESRITELGVFELWCKSTRGDQSWKLELNVRE